MDRIEVGDTVTRRGVKGDMFEVVGVYRETGRLWLKRLPYGGPLTYDADAFVKVEPFFEAGKTYTRGGGGENSRINVFACTASETDTDGERVAFGRYYDDEMVDSYVWTTLHSLYRWKEHS